MEIVFIGVGSNIQPETNVVRALELLEKQVRVTAASTFFTTEPIGRPEQARYANGVFRVDADLAPRAMKELLSSIESELGRTRGMDRYAPRTIDLDLLLYGDRVINEGTLIIPHPDLLARTFIAAALLELAPALIVPGTGNALSALVRIDNKALITNARLTRDVGRALLRHNS